MSSIGTLYDKRTDKDNKGVYKISFILLAIFIPSVLFALDIPPTEFTRCSAIKNNVERLSCFDDLSKQYKLDKPAVSITSKGNWAITKSISPIDDSTNIYLGVYGDKDFEGWPSGTYKPLLILRCKENDTKMLVNTGMTPNVEYEHGRTTVTLRYDKEKAFNLRMFNSTDKKALLFPSPIENIKQMMNHNTLLFRFRPYNSSPTLTTFKIAGLSEAIKPLRESCNW